MWTRRDFSAYTLRLFAERPEIKDRYWTANRAIYCPGGSDYHPEKKHIVLDGRLRGDPSAGKVFSIMFLVHMVPADGLTAGAANLVFAEAKVKLSAEIELAKGSRPSKTMHVDCPDIPGICYLTNPKKIEAQTMLLAVKDPRIEKIVKETAELRKKDERNNVSFWTVRMLGRGRSAC